MKTHYPQLIKTVDDLNDRNARIRRGVRVETYGSTMWDDLGIEEA